MPVKIKVGIPDPELDGRFRVVHQFYGRNERDARRVMNQHADVCPNFGPAVKSDGVVEEIIDIDDDEWPSSEDPLADDPEYDDDGDELIERDEED